MLVKETSSTILNNTFILFFASTILYYDSWKDYGTNSIFKRFM